MLRISPKDQITLPVEALANAGFAAGDEVLIEADDPGCIVVRRAHRDLEAVFGVFDGLYEPGYLDRLRSEARV